ALLPPRARRRRARPGLPRRAVATDADRRRHLPVARHPGSERPAGRRAGVARPRRRAPVGRQGRRLPRLRGRRARRPQARKPRSLLRGDRQLLLRPPLLSAEPARAHEATTAHIAYTWSDHVAAVATTSRATPSKWTPSLSG